MSTKRQISESEKSIVLQQHGRVCFVDGVPIPEDEVVEFHHIRAYSDGGPSNIDNIAPVCRRHHRTIGTMSLQVYRDKLELDSFFDNGEKKYLDDVITARNGHCGEQVVFEIEGERITLYFDSTPHDLPLYECPTTGWKYFYANIPIKFLENDKELQPRALRKKSLWILYRHFQTNTQLAPSICRLDDNRIIRIFDGQHKAAAQIWNGRQILECKVYLGAQENDLKETNLEAHGKFRQMSFYSHELMNKYADIFGEDWNLYMDLEGEKSESGFMGYLINEKGKSRAEARKELMLSLHKDIVDNTNNKLSGYLSEKNRSRKQPLTFSRLKKTILQNMLVPPPVSDEFESDTDFRNDERNNLIKLMNIITEEGLDGKWNPERNDTLHQRTQKIFSAGAIRAWTILLRDTFNIHLKHYTEDERKIFFYRPISEDDFNYFRKFVIKLFSHKIWDDPDPTGEIAARLSKDDATTAKSLFDEKGLTVQWLLDSP